MPRALPGSWGALLHLGFPGCSWKSGPNSRPGLPRDHLGDGRGSKQDSAQLCRDQLLQCCLADGAQEGDHLFPSETLNFSL